MGVIAAAANLKPDQKKCVLLLTLFYLLTCSYLYTKYGVKIVNDSPRYLGYAANIATQGVYFDALNFWYISYAFFVYFSQLIMPGAWIIIFNQYVLGYLAVLAMYGATKRLTGSVRTGLLAGMIFIFFPDNLNWQSYVLTESLYRSLLCIIFYLLARVSQEKEKWLYVVLAGALLACFFSKPTSPALFIALAFPFFWKWLAHPAYRIWKFSSLAAVAIILLVLANTMISEHQVMLIYAKGDIIFAMHQAPEHIYHESMTIEVPETLKVSPEDWPLLQQMGWFVYSNPWYFIKLFFAKMIMFIVHVRPFWSWSHNLTMTLFLWPLYYFFYLALKKQLVSAYLRKVCVAYCLLHTLIISITWVDWDGRFFIPLIPVLVVVGAIGLSDRLKHVGGT